MNTLIAYVSITILYFVEARILLQNTPNCGQVAALYHKLGTILLDYVFYWKASIRLISTNTRYYLLVVSSILGFPLHFLVGLSDSLMAICTDSCRPAGKNVWALSKEVKSSPNTAPWCKHTCPSLDTAMLIVCVYLTCIIVQGSLDSMVKMFYSAAKWLRYSICYA